MARSKNLFVEGKMNKDLDERLIPKGQYRDALNVRIGNSSGSDVGAIENALSNKKVSSLNFGTNPKCIGACTNPSDETVYWFVVSDNGSYIAEYNDFDKHTAIILEDTRAGETNVLNFKTGAPIDCNVLVDDDNDKTYIYFTDGVTQPKKIEVEDAKLLINSGFTFDDISVIVKPPIHPPTIELASSGEELEKKNNLKEKFVMFSYRYKYKDNQFSAASPFSPVAFLPEKYNYNFEDHVLECMVNSFDQVKVTFNTGDKNVQEVDVLFKESGQNTIYLAKSFDKSVEDIDNNVDHTFTFSNNQIYKVLPEKEVFRLYDNVPLTAKTQELINNRLVYGNYTENYDLLDEAGDEVNPDIQLTYSQTVKDDNEAFTSVKSNRDYEVGIVYLDEHGRSSTVLSGGENSIYVKPYASITQNDLYAVVKHKAPTWAKYYRFFIKETVNDYNNICSSTFHVGDDENDIYVKLGGDDVNKIKDGDFVTMKRGTNGVLKVPETMMIREVEKKDRNFLDYDDNATNTEQEPGVYMALKQRSSFLIQADSFTEYNYDTRMYANESNVITNPYHNTTAGPYFYGFDEDTDDLNFVSATYPPTGEMNDFFRVEIQISEQNATADKFRYRVKCRGKYRDDNQDNEFNGKWQNWSDQIDCSTSNIDIDIAQDGTGTQQKIVVNWTAATGHNLGDKWTFTFKPQHSWKAHGSIDTKKRAYTNAMFPTGDDGKMLRGSFATIFIHEDEASKNVYQAETETIYASQDYETFEEFYWEERIYELLAAQGLYEHYISFHRGVQTTGKTAGRYKTITGTATDNEIMFYESKNYRPHTGQPAPAATLSIELNATEGQNSTFLAETKTEPINTDLYYEIGKTYEVTNFGYHKGDSDVGDTDQDALGNARIKLDFFNCFAWGNTGHESIKIKDSFFGAKYLFDTRPLSTIEKYQENERRASLTYSNVYDQTTNYNGLNEFNLSTANYKDLDDADGDIQRIISRDTNLAIFQENKISQVLYNKNVLFTAGGDGSVSQSTEVLGQQIPYLGEYGVTNSPHSISVWGGRIYLADPRRGAILRLSQDGITEISQYGMRDWFRDNMNVSDSTILGGYDPQNGQYVVSIQNPVIEWREEDVNCETYSWEIDLVECIQEGTTTTTTSTTTTTTTTTLATFTCTDANFTIADGQTGVGTLSYSSVDAGLITSVSPSTYTAGSATYTATITVPAGYANAGSSITCTDTATGTSTTTTTTTTTAAPTTTTTTTTTTLPVFGCTDAGFTMSDGTVGDTTLSLGSTSAGVTLQSVSPSTLALGTNTYTATVVIPTGFQNAGSTYSLCTDTANGVATTTTTTTTTAAPTTTTTTTQLCYFYDLSNDSDQAVTFTYQRCGGNTLTTTVGVGSSTTVCAVSGSVTMSPDGGTITQGNQCN